MDRTIVLPYEPTTSQLPFEKRHRETAAGGLIAAPDNLDSCIYISVPKSAITGFGELISFVHYHYLLLAHVTLKLNSPVLQLT